MQLVRSDTERKLLLALNVLDEAEGALSMLLSVILRGLESITSEQASGLQALLQLNAAGFNASQ